jgi:hypothetical protein
LINVILGSGLIAVILGLYAYYVYPLVGKRWTAILALSLLTLGFLATIRFARRFHEKTVASLLGSQAELPSLRTKVETLESDLAATTQNLADLQKRLEPYLTFIFEPNKEPFKPYFPRIDVTQYRVCVISPVPVNDVELVANKVEIDGITHDVFT